MKAALLILVVAAMMYLLLTGCEPCYDPAGQTDYPGCTSLTDRWEGVN